ncbi:unnamed protein product [Urochloa humidicola]
MAPAETGNIVWQEEDEAPMAMGAGAKLGLAGLLGIATSSVASTLAVRDPPPGLVDENAYFLAVAGAFFAGVAGIFAAVFISNNNPRGRRAAGRKQLIMYASLGPLAAVVGLLAASLLW